MLDNQVQKKDVLDQWRATTWESPGAGEFMNGH